MFHGKGGYDWNTVYNMPIWLRNYTFSLLNEYYTKQSQPEQATKTKDTKVVVPDYVAKAPRN